MEETKHLEENDQLNQLSMNIWFMRETHVIISFILWKV